MTSDGGREQVLTSAAMFKLELTCLRAETGMLWACTFTGRWMLQSILEQGRGNISTGSVCRF